MGARHSWSEHFTVPERRTGNLLPGLACLPYW
jgi:hypothetical protein